MTRRRRIEVIIHAFRMYWFMGAIFSTISLPVPLNYSLAMIFFGLWMYPYKKTKEEEELEMINRELEDSICEEPIQRNAL